jgi:arsenate reductase
MAEGLLRHDAGDRFEVLSAGIQPSAVRPEAISAMRELGIDISAHRSKSLNELMDEFSGQQFDYVLTICDHARECCPIFPAGPSKSITTSKTPPPSRVPNRNAWRFSAACATRSATT